uniref:Secreted protein n=1 Tax=Steinernema glaseri TaxID=37863 RepID=A0A1I7ZLI2_9BILA
MFPIQAARAHLGKTKSSFCFLLCFRRHIIQTLLSVNGPCELMRTHQSFSSEAHSCHSFMHRLVMSIQKHSKRLWKTGDSVCRQSVALPGPHWKVRLDESLRSGRLAHEQKRVLQINRSSSVIRNDAVYTPILFKKKLEMEGSGSLQCIIRIHFSVCHNDALSIENGLIWAALSDCPQQIIARKRYLQ